MKMNNTKQVAGTHYERLSIQPVQIIVKYKLNWFQGEALKYISRFPYKGGPTDLQKCWNILHQVINFYGPTLFDDQDFQLVEEGSEPFLETYINQFKVNYFRESTTFEYFHRFIYRLVSRNYPKAKQDLELINYSEYEE